MPKGTPLYRVAINAVYPAAIYGVTIHIHDDNEMSFNSRKICIKVSQSTKIGVLKKRLSDENDFTLEAGQKLMLQGSHDLELQDMYFSRDDEDQLFYLPRSKGKYIFHVVPSFHKSFLSASEAEDSLNLEKAYETENSEKAKDVDENILREILRKINKIVKVKGVRDWKNPEVTLLGGNDLGWEFFNQTKFGRIFHDSVKIPQMDANGDICIFSDSFNGYVQYKKLRVFAEMCREGGIEMTPFVHQFVPPTPLPPNYLEKALFRGNLYGWKIRIASPSIEELNQTLKEKEQRIQMLEKKLKSHEDNLTRVYDILTMQPTNTLAVGDKVEARYYGSRKFHPASIQRINADGTYYVLFDDGDIMEYAERSDIKSSSMNKKKRKQKANSTVNKRKR